MKTERWAFAFLISLFSLLAPVRAFAADAPVVEAKIQANPALWTVHSANATAYLLGAIHILPANVIWHTPAIDAAIDASDTFVFEAPIDSTGQSAIAAFIRAHGLLPADVTLPSLLDDRGRRDYRDALALTKLPPDRLDQMRPWLAAIVLETTCMEQLHYSPTSGVDRQIVALATARNKSLAYFETDEQQLALLMPTDQKLEVQEFDAGLRQFRSDSASLGPLVDAWSQGNARLVGRLMNKELDTQPGAKKALIDDRNDAWVVQLDKMLREHHTYFITVGTGHLVGPHGVPALLRARGYAVEGP
ncbi:MAG: TraB/GumN family protein [Rhizomicrobium sp.]